MGLIAFHQWKQHLWRSSKMKASTCVRQTVTLGLNYVYHTANMCRLVFSVTLTQPTEVSCFETMVETVPTLIALIILCIRLTKPFGTKLSSIWFLKWKVSRWGLRKKPKRRLTLFQSSLFSNPMNPITKNTDGTIAWDSMQGDRFLATGVDRYGKRFRTTSVDFKFIRCINLWRGTKWLVRNGKRYKLYSVYN